MRISPPPPRSSAIGPLASTSHVERSVICRHCQKVHNAGFIWNFSETIRVCFTCYREMGEAGRKSYERAAARGRIGLVRKVIGILALSIVLLGTTAYFYYKPPTGEIAELRAWVGEGWRGK